MSSESRAYEGFVSCRQASLGLAGEIVSRLQAFGIRCGDQHSAGKRSQKAHGGETRNIIRAADFCVVLIEPGFYTPSAGDGGVNYQFDEIDFALKEVQARERFTKEPGLDCTYVVFPVLVSDDESVIEAEFLAALRDDVPATLQPTYQCLYDVGDRMQIPQFRDKGSILRNLAVNDVVGAIAKRVIQLRKAKQALKDHQDRQRAEEAAKKKTKDGAGRKAGEAADEAAAPAEPEDLTRHLVESYVELAANAWQRGKVSNQGQAKARTETDSSRNPFAFVSTRFMHLDGELERGGKQSADIDRQPLSAWVLRRQPGILYLLGEAGTGKTTVAAAAAMAYAWHWQPRKFEKGLSEFARGAWLREAEHHLAGAAEPFLPIFVSIPQLVSHFEDLSAIGPHELVEAITKCLHGEFGKRSKSNRDGVTANDVEALMERQNVVLILDGLDEVGAGLGEQIHIAAQALHTQLYDPEVDRFRMIITSRPGLRGVAASDPQVRVLGPDWSGVEAFVAQYVNDQSHASARSQDQVRLLESARSLFDSRDNAKNRIVQRPLFLNVLCWYVSATDGVFKRHSFCEDVLDDLIASRAFHEIESRIDEAGASAARAPDIARRLLAWLAHATFTEGGSFGEASSNAAMTNLVRKHAEFGLVPLKQKCAEAILNELAAETSLLTVANRKISFAGQHLFCEYLVSEAIESLDPDEVVAAIKDKQADNWKNTLAFAEARRRVREDGFPYSSALLSRSQRLSAQRESKAAEQFLTAAISVLDENTDHDLPDIRNEVRKAIEVYREGEPHWTLGQRDSLLRKLVPLGSRDIAATQRKAVQSIFDTLLHPRKVWVECKAPGLPPGFSMADGHVHVAAYAVFADAEDALDPELWDHVPDVPDVPEIAENALRILGRTYDKPDPATVNIWLSQSRRLGAPVVGVTWYEAVAYCRWLTRKLREDGNLSQDELIRLPTVSEWKAVSALCANGRTYPFGNAVSPEVANTGLLNLDGPSVIGLFPACGPGLYDFGSNARCWTVADKEDRPSWPPKPAVRYFKQGAPRPDMQRAAGGSWACEDERIFAAALTPQSFDADIRRRIFGFRLALVKTNT